jgi:hypothetical protein
MKAVRCIFLIVIMLTIQGCIFLVGGPRRGHHHPHHGHRPVVVRPAPRPPVVVVP